MKSPFKSLKSVFGKKKGKKVGESNNTKEDTEYDTEKEGSESDIKGSDLKGELANTMANIADLTMVECKKRMRDDTGSGLVQPAIPTTATIELKGHILAQLKDIPFYGKDHEDAYNHIDEVNDIVDYFNIPNVPHKTVLLRMLPITFNGVAKD